MRAETGAMQFGDDWPGVFIRGDNAAGYALALSQVLQQHGRADVFGSMQLAGLLRVLTGCRVGEGHDVQMMKSFGEATEPQASKG